MGVPLFLQFSIALFTGMVAATFVSPVRRSIPRWVEVSLWVALIVSCVLGVMSVNEPHARELTATVVWGVDQILNTAVGLLGAGVLAWLYGHRFALADGMFLLLGADILALVLIRSWRSGRAWQPRVLLREWMELPSPLAAEPHTVAPYALDDLNRRWAAAISRAAGVSRTGLVRASAWARDVMLPREAQRLARGTAAARVESRERLESIRDAAAQVQFAASSWYTVAGAPAVDGLTARAVVAVKNAANVGRGRRAARSGPEHVGDIQARLSVESAGWSGPIFPALPTHTPEDDGSEQQPDRLAS